MHIEYNVCMNGEKIKNIYLKIFFFVIFFCTPGECQYRITVYVTTLYNSRLGYMATLYLEAARTCLLWVQSVTFQLV